jgi:hypothetical protein
MDRFGAYARILFWGVVLQPDRRLGIDDAYVHDPRNQHHCYRIQRRQFVCQDFRSGRDGNGAGERSQHVLLLAGMLGLAGASFARRLATQKVKLRLQF